MISEHQRRMTMTEVLQHEGGAWIWTTVDTHDPVDELAKIAWTSLVCVSQPQKAAVLAYEYAEAMHAERTKREQARTEKDNAVTNKTESATTLPVESK
jgi:CO dehydrogenase/acetyl-CoA synthase alpha subunit